MRATLSALAESQLALIASMMPQHAIQVDASVTLTSTQICLQTLVNMVCVFDRFAFALALTFVPTMVCALCKLPFSCFCLQCALIKCIPFCRSPLIVGSFVVPVQLSGLLWSLRSSWHFKAQRRYPNMWASWHEHTRE